MLNSRLKLAYSQKLLSDFAAEYKSFIKTNYKVIREDTDDGKTVARLHIKQEIPKDAGLVIGDIVHNLRSALDLLISDLLFDNGSSPSEVSAFPVSKTESIFLTQGLDKIKGIKDSVIETIKELKPYKDGNSLLWELHQLDIIEKHRIIIPIVSENKAVVLDFGEHMSQMFGDEKLGNIPSMPLGLVPTDRKIEDGNILFSADKSFWSISSQYPKFEFELVFGKGDLLAGESITKKLNEYLTLVENILDKFEGELTQKKT